MINSELDVSKLKQVLIESLLKYLPDIAILLSKLISFVKSVAETNQKPDEIKEILSELKSMLTKISLLIEEIDGIVTEAKLTFKTNLDNYSKSDIKTHEEIIGIVDTYGIALKDTIDGITAFLDWYMGTDHNNNELVKSVNLLFSSSKKVTDLVNTITNA